MGIIRAWILKYNITMSEKIKVLVTGSTGLVGSHFVDKNVDFDLLTPSSREFNLLDPQSIKSYLDKNKPDWIVNFAAYTDVNKSELEKGNEEGVAWQTNVVGVKNILDALKSKKFIQISTDMVFPGSAEQPGPYKESDTPPDTNDNLTWYGWTKNRAEDLVRKSGGAIVRIVYPITFEFDKRLDYVRSPIKRFASGKMYPMFNDQQVSVTYIAEVAQVLNKIIKDNLEGVFHVSSDTTTPFDLIKGSLEGIGEDSESLKSSSVVEFLKTQDNPSRYPVFGGLDATETAKKLGLHFSSWKELLQKIPDKKTGPRKYSLLEIQNSVVVNPTKYMSKPDGYVMDTADFTELSYYLGYKFQVRSVYTISSPEGIARGGHLESRSKNVTIVSGLVYYCMVDLRPGDGYLKSSEFYLGEGQGSLGSSVLVPEGVVDYFIPVNGTALYFSIADRPFNMFDTLHTLNMMDPEIGLHIPEKILKNLSEDVETKVLNLKEFKEKI